MVRSTSGGTTDTAVKKRTPERISGSTVEEAFFHQAGDSGWKSGIAERSLKGRRGGAREDQAGGGGELEGCSTEVAVDSKEEKESWTTMDDPEKAVEEVPGGPWRVSDRAFASRAVLFDAERFSSSVNTGHWKRGRNNGERREGEEQRLQKKQTVLTSRSLALDAISNLRSQLFASEEPYAA